MGDEVVGLAIDVNHATARRLVVESKLFGLMRDHWILTLLSTYWDEKGKEIVTGRFVFDTEQSKESANLAHQAQRWRESGKRGHFPELERIGSFFGSRKSG